MILEQVWCIGSTEVVMMEQGEETSQLYHDNHVKSASGMQHDDPYRFDLVHRGGGLAVATGTRRKMEFTNKQVRKQGRTMVA